MTKMALASLNATDEAGFMAALGDMYEHAPWSYCTYRGS